jgi:hypothetical protein
MRRLLFPTGAKAEIGKKERLESEAPACCNEMRICST